MHRSLARGAAALALALLILVPDVAGAGPPTDQLRSAVERVTRALEDPALKGPGKTDERRSTLRRIANDFLDFEEMARRALGRHWQARSDKERREFVELFADLLERAYLAKIELYTGERVAYTNERVEGDYAAVATRFVTKSGTEVPVDYRLLRRGDRWLVYDVNIEGVSLVANYRTQFNKIIQTESYAELVARLRAKQDEAAAPGGSAPRAQP